jgi:hypothetical protein
MLTNIRDDFLHQSTENSANVKARIVFVGNQAQGVISCSKPFEPSKQASNPKEVFSQ